MKKRENEFVLTLDDIIYSWIFWVPLFLIAIPLVTLCHNYLMASILFFLWVKYMGNTEVHPCKSKFTKHIVERYPYTIKLLLELVVFVTIMLSYFSFKAFLCSIILSIYWNEYKKLLKVLPKKRKA